MKNECLTLRKMCPFLELLWSLFTRIQSECGKMRYRITLYMDTFHAVQIGRCRYLRHNARNVTVRYSTGGQKKRMRNKFQVPICVLFVKEEVELITFLHLKYKFGQQNFTFLLNMNFIKSCKTFFVDKYHKRNSHKFPINSQKNNNLKAHLQIVWQM